MVIGVVAPNVDVDDVCKEDAPHTTSEFPPYINPPVDEVTGLILPPKVIGAKLLLLKLLNCPKPNEDPKGLILD